MLYCCHMKLSVKEFYLVSMTNEVLAAKSIAAVLFKF